MKHSNRRYQKGASFLGNLVLLVLFVYGGYLGIQYVPQLIESKSLDSMLTSLESQHHGQAYTSAQDVEKAVKNMLNLNQMDDMIQNIKIRQSGNIISVEVNYERELDLLFQQKTLTYSKILDLN